MIYWKKLAERTKNRIERALEENVNFSKDASYGHVEVEHLTAFINELKVTAHA